MTVPVVLVATPVQPCALARPGAASVRKTIASMKLLHQTKRESIRTVIEASSPSGLTSTLAGRCCSRKTFSNRIAILHIRNTSLRGGQEAV